MIGSVLSLLGSDIGILKFLFGLFFGAVAYKAKGSMNVCEAAAVVGVS